MPYDVDGYVPPEMTEDHNYCRHGVYVGGCGYDHMCHWCEMGEDPPPQSVVDAQRLAKAERDYDQWVALLDEHAVRHGSWTRARLLAWLGRQCFDIHAGSWPINGSVVLAWERSQP